MTPMRPAPILTLVPFVLASTSRAQQQEAPTLGDAFAKVQKAADSFPPKFSSDQDREEVLQLRHRAEAGLVRTLQEKTAPGANVDLVPGDLYRMGGIPSTSKERAKRPSSISRPRRRSTRPTRSRTSSWGGISLSAMSSPRASWSCCAPAPLRRQTIARISTTSSR
jgi:hypothetical protein